MFLDLGDRERLMPFILRAVPLTLRRRKGGKEEEKGIRPIYDTKISPFPSHLTSLYRNFFRGRRKKEIPHFSLPRFDFPHFTLSKEKSYIFLLFFSREMRARDERVLLPIRPFFDRRLSEGRTNVTNGREFPFLHMVYLSISSLQN